MAGGDAARSLPAQSPCRGRTHGGQAARNRAAAGDHRGTSGGVAPRVVARARDGAGGERCAEPVEAAERLRGQSAGGDQPQVQLVRGQRTRRRDGGDPVEPDSDVQTSRRRSPTLPDTSVDERAARERRRPRAMAPGPVEGRVAVAGNLRDVVGGAVPDRQRQAARDRAVGVPDGRDHASGTTGRLAL